MKPYDAWERDAISAQEYLDATVFYEPRSFTHEDFLEAIFSDPCPCPMGRSASFSNWLHLVNACWAR